MILARILFPSIISCRSVRCLLVMFVFIATFSTTTAAPLYVPVRIEVFTTSDLQVESKLSIEIKEQNQEVDLHIFEVNGIQSVEADLSTNLPADPDQSKHLALQRIQMLDNQVRAHMQHSAIGLAKAMQYGIDRYPAIVFDGQAVIFGVTDLKAALAHYQSWRTEVKP